MDIEKLRKDLLENSDPDGPCIEDDLMQAAATAISTIPALQAKLEKVFPGCPYCKEDLDGYVQKFGAYSIQGGELTTGHCKPQKINFCPHCSRPLTDEAVEMVMERINKMEETGNGLG